MINENFDKDKEKLELIAVKSGTVLEKVVSRYEQKTKSLSGLVKPSVIVELVAKELGVDLKPKKIKQEEKDMSVWDDIDLSTNEFNPFLKVKNGITYHLELVDPLAKPRPSVDGYGNNQHIWDVKLINLDPVEAFEATDKDGKAIFMKNGIYSFGLKKTAMIRFKALWEAVEVVKKFTFKRIGQSFQTDYVFKED